MLQLPESERRRLWNALIEILEDLPGVLEEQPVAPVLDPEGIRADLGSFDFTTPRDPVEALAFAAANLTRHQVHTPHPRYFGLFNPAPSTMGIAADALVAGFNPQLAAWSHSPWAAEVERHLVQVLGERIGLGPGRIGGTFASGGAEANHTALLVALTRAFPGFAVDGAADLPGRPTIYLSSEGHHSFQKASRLSGIGERAARVVPVDSSLRMDPRELRRLLEADRGAGHRPVLLVGTAGTTGAGLIDPLPALADIAREQGLWFHVDAAWGGAAALVPELREALTGIERADSVTLDAHKLLSVPMGAGIFLTRHPEAMRETFEVRTGYMPREARGLPVDDPYASSMQWSRRFIGLKLFLTLAVAGWTGYAETIRHQTRMGEELRDRLTAAGWTVVNRTPLPLVCFIDGTNRVSPARLPEILTEVLRSGEAWLSVTPLGEDGLALRACITNYRTGPADLDRLVTALNRARESVAAPGRSAS